MQARCQLSPQDASFEGKGALSDETDGEWVPIELRNENIHCNFIQVFLTILAGKLNLKSFNIDLRA